MRDITIPTNHNFITNNLVVHNCGEEGFNIALDMISTEKLDLVIIDSDSSLIPKKVIDGEVGESAIGLKARLNSSAYPKLKNALVDNNVCVLVVSQYREKIGIMYGNPATTQGGHALKYYADGRIEISKTIAKDGDVPVGNLTKIKCIKNKTSSPYKGCEFTILWGIGVDRFEECITLAVDLGIIKKSGTWFSYGETKIGQGMDNAKTLLADNIEFYEEIKEKVIEKLKESDNAEEITTEEGLPKEDSLQEA